jgi:hypothetical protein
MNDRPSSPTTPLPPPPPDVRQSSLPLAATLGTPLDFRHGGIQGAAAPGPTADTDLVKADGADAPRNGARRQQATETIAQRAGALSDEIDFPDFVASLLHGTFDAIVDTAIRQMESYASLVSAVAKSVEQFTEDNVTLNQARDWLTQQYPNDLRLDLAESPKVLPKPAPGEEPDQPRSPDWLKDFQLEGEELTPELIEERLVPLARARVGQGRQQTLATMVLLGLNRVVVRDGSVSARLRFRASAADTAKVDYAVSDDPQGGSSWGNRGSGGYQLPSTKVSTVGVNVQSDAELRAELFGEVKINFASETLPLERFVDEAKRTLLERRAKPTPGSRPAAPKAAGLPASAPTELVPAPGPVPPAAPAVSEPPPAAPSLAAPPK